MFKENDQTHCVVLESGVVLEENPYGNHFFGCDLPKSYASQLHLHLKARATLTQRLPVVVAANMAISCHQRDHLKARQAISTPFNYFQHSKSQQFGIAQRPC